MRTLLFALSFAIAACGKQEVQESYGLEVISIRMEPGALSQLNSSYNDKKSYPAMVTHGARQDEARVSYAGRTTLDAWKKSWDIEINGLTWRLSATPDDPTMLRSVAGYKLFAMAGFQVPKMSHVFVYLNDEPAGLFLRKELVSEKFFHDRRMAVRSLYKAHYNDKRMDERLITQLPEFFSAKFHLSGFRQEKNWSDLRPLVKEMVYTPKAISRIEENSLLRYHAATVALSNWDGFSNNYFLYNTVDQPDLFRFQPWDLDRAFEADTTTFGMIGNDFWGDYIVSDADRFAAYLRVLAATVDLMESDEFRQHLTEQAALIAAAWTADRALSAHAADFSRTQETLREKVAARGIYLRSLLRQASDSPAEEP